MNTIVRRSVLAAAFALGAALWPGIAAATEGPQEYGAGFQWSSSIPGEPSRGPSSPWIGGKLDLNMADVKDLAGLPGIGWDRALAIREYRDQNGLLGSVDELLWVPGIAREQLDAIRDRVRVAE